MPLVAPAFLCFHSVITSRLHLPANGPEKLSVCVEQTVLRHWRGSLPDHRQRSGLLPPDLPARSGSGDKTHYKDTFFLPLNLFHSAESKLKTTFSIHSPAVQPQGSKLGLEISFIPASSSNRSSALTCSPAALFCYSISKLNLSTKHFRKLDKDQSAEQMRSSGWLWMLLGSFNKWHGSTFSCCCSLSLSFSITSLVFLWTIPKECCALGGSIWHPILCF